jgi:hypothetical protein
MLAGCAAEENGCLDFIHIGHAPLLDLRKAQHSLIPPQSLLEQQADAYSVIIS